jgi:hypothetical protein
LTPEGGGNERRCDATHIKYERVSIRGKFLKHDPEKACPALDAGVDTGFPPARSPWRHSSFGLTLRRAKAGRKNIMLKQ